MMPSSKGFRSGKEKRSGDPLSIGAIVAELLQRREFATGTQVGRLAATWAAVVGERLAEETAPIRLDGGTLTVAASSGAWGTQVQFLAEEVRRKANEYLDSQAVVRVRVVVAEKAAKPL